MSDKTKMPDELWVDGQGQARWVPPRNTPSATRYVRADLPDNVAEAVERIDAMVRDEDANRGGRSLKLIIQDQDAADLRTILDYLKEPSDDQD